MGQLDELLDARELLDGPPQTVHSQALGRCRAGNVLGFQGVDGVAHGAHRSLEDGHRPGRRAQHPPCPRRLAGGFRDGVRSRVRTGTITGTGNGFAGEGGVGTRIGPGRDTRFTPGSRGLRPELRDRGLESGEHLCGSRLGVALALDQVCAGQPSRRREIGVERAARERRERIGVRDQLGLVPGHRTEHRHGVHQLLAGTLQVSERRIRPAVGGLSLEPPQAASGLAHRLPRALQVAARGRQLPGPEALLRRALGFGALLDEQPRLRGQVDAVPRVGREHPFAGSQVVVGVGEAQRLGGRPSGLDLRDEAAHLVANIALIVDQAVQAVFEPVGAAQAVGELEDAPRHELQVDPGVVVAGRGEPYRVGEPGGALPQGGDGLAHGIRRPAARGLAGTRRIAAGRLAVARRNAPRRSTVARRIAAGRWAVTRRIAGTGGQRETQVEGGAIAQLRVRTGPVPGVEKQLGGGFVVARPELLQPGVVHRPGRELRRLRPRRDGGRRLARVGPGGGFLHRVGALPSGGRGQRDGQQHRRAGARDGSGRPVKRTSHFPCQRCDDRRGGGLPRAWNLRKPVDSRPITDAGGAGTAAPRTVGGTFRDLDGRARERRLHGTLGAAAHDVHLRTRPRDRGEPAQTAPTRHAVDASTSQR